MNFHICIPIDVVIESIVKGGKKGRKRMEMILNNDYNTILKQMFRLQNQGKKYFTGCDNEDIEGRCAGHLTLEKKEDETIILSGV